MDCKTAAFFLFNFFALIFCPTLSTAQRLHDTFPILAQVLAVFLPLQPVLKHLRNTKCLHSNESQAEIVMTFGPTPRHSEIGTRLLLLQSGSGVPVFQSRCAEEVEGSSPIALRISRGEILYRRENRVFKSRCAEEIECSSPTAPR
eukprot:TRINITY_DN7758_c0_g1_i1.p1 TRINITY_DN7758_c0_g1~~TRINITY_DN7758_c0_g1_i1.p1  ORF type:complete len:146 (-),score=9.81 TRINITY_DN7758_c0_g1_i1:244-681(-)